MIKLDKSSTDAKAAEAAASGTAYYDPNTNFAYVPPPYVSRQTASSAHFKLTYKTLSFFFLHQSNEAPPSYEDSKDKKMK